jgi:endo-1,4-beta-D-glucanase Y
VSLVAAMSLAATGCGSSSPSPAPTTSVTGTNAFLDRYVAADGRVLRHDQGGDIVSEGQAYAMLIAETADRPRLVRTIWAWTIAHLRRPDGLLKYHATGSGDILDDQSASDADVLAAYALLRYRGPDAARLDAAGKHLAAAVLRVETISADSGPVVVAGPWATQTAPPTVNPSYLMPSVYAALGVLTGDERWQRAATTAELLVNGLTHDGQQLPTDWAQLANGRLTAAAEPGGGAPVQYGLDAARLPLWFGTACSQAARSLAAGWWHAGLSRPARAAAIALAPDGRPTDRARNPMPLMAAAAAASAAGDQQAVRVLRDHAAALARSRPTYYGDAWLALGGALLDGVLDPCQEATDG